jgi:DNA-binding transcriptional regulator YiaG
MARWICQRDINMPAHYSRQESPISAPQPLKTIRANKFASFIIAKQSCTEKASRATGDVIDLNAWLTSGTNISSYRKADTVENKTSETKKEKTNSTSQDITHIIDIMNISVSELARVFQVSRQAVHNWINGAALSPQNTEYLSKLAQAAHIFAEAKIEIRPSMLRRKLDDNDSLLDAIKNGVDISSSVKQLIETLSLEAKQRQRLSSRLEGHENIPIPIDAFGAPHLNEN